jgi:hypothetical protein
MAGATAWEEEGVEVEAETWDGRATDQEAEGGGGGGGSGGHGARQRSRGEECEVAEWVGVGKVSEREDKLRVKKKYLKKIKKG